MAKITYLLGAGASCQCLPTYIDFAHRFFMFYQFLQHYRQILSGSDQMLCDQLLQYSETLNRELLFHNTPDTVAKKYFHLSASDDLNNLKVILTLFFLYEQSMDKSLIDHKIMTASTNINYDKKFPVEKRYDSFIASILEPVYGSLNLNPEFNILTWNYDLQFEIAFNNYSKVSFDDSNNAIQSIPFCDMDGSKFNVDKFSIVHLNGISYSPVSINPFCKFYSSAKNLTKHLISHYSQMKKIGNETYINFAWERHPSFPHPTNTLNKTMQHAESIACETEILVVIGYSFPIFNRDVDLALMKEMTNLHRIYVQSLDGNQLKKTLKDIFEPVNRRINETSIDVINDYNSFHIPLEANTKPGDYSFG